MPKYIVEHTQPFTRTTITRYEAENLTDAISKAMKMADKDLPIEGALLLSASYEEGRNEYLLNVKKEP